MANTKDWWLKYMRSHPGTSGPANVFYDVFLQYQKLNLTRKQTIEMIEIVLEAYGARVIEIMKKRHP
jgi:hypothetical protein